MLGKRLLTSLWAILVIVAAVWFDTPLPWFTVLGVIAGILAIIEFYHLVGVSKVLPLTILGVILTVLFIIAPHFDFDIPVSSLSLLVTAAVTLPMIVMIFVPKQEGLFRLWAWTLTSVFYIGWLISYLVEIRLIPDTTEFVNAGRNLIILTFFVTFGSDSAAYFVGKAIGKHKMAPSISPGKSWEGAVAGVIGAAGVCYLFTFDTPFQVPLSILSSIILGILVSIFGQLGDLAESVLKRGVGVKDSGKLMPGHGGIMDRMDSLLFAGIVVYLFYVFVVR
jgi:phosphatidate cytidylyltransferase